MTYSDEKHTVPELRLRYHNAEQQFSKKNNRDTIFDSTDRNRSSRGYKKGETHAPPYEKVSDLNASIFYLRYTRHKLA